jgi:hypothetical protein
MAFQTDVKSNQAFGVVGELYDTSIRRVTPYKLAAASTIGRPAWLTEDGKATGTFASGLKLLGIFVNPKEYTHKGNVADVTLEMTADSIAQVADLGHVNAIAGAAIKVGDTVYFNTTSNIFTTVAEGGVAVGKCVRAGASVGEVFVLQIAVA